MSFDAEARKDAVLADESSADIVERTNAIVEPTALNLVFSGQGLSFHGFSTNAFAVRYKNVTYLRFADDMGNQGVLVIDYIDDNQRDGSDRETSQESVTGLSSVCTNGLQEYLDKQGVTLSELIGTARYFPRSCDSMPVVLGIVPAGHTLQVHRYAVSHSSAAARASANSSSVIYLPLIWLRKGSSSGRIDS